MSAPRRFSYKSLVPLPLAREEEEDVPKPKPRVAGSKFLMELGSTDKFVYGVIGAGLIVALLLDAGVRLFKKPSSMGRLVINGRIYVPLD